MTTVHWLGCGLSSGPGIERLGAGNTPLVLWNRSLDKARALVKTDWQHVTARALDMTAVAGSIKAGDILVSMLPASFHAELARLALDAGAHFVCSSYLSDEMRSLDSVARQRGLSLVNEVGLDPGLDHLIAHALVGAYRDSGGHRRGDSLSFRSYCGGFPREPNAFRYKFSWSPAGVLRALASPARYIADGAEVALALPFEAVTPYEVVLPTGSEAFEAYPNRDSLPFIRQYGFDSDWQVREFVRGTLRLPGWATAWQPLFDEIRQMGKDIDSDRLGELSEALWSRHRYAPGEPDRVVLAVELAASREGKTVWHRAGVIDTCGDPRGSAMARLVSYPVAIAVQSVVAGNVPPGVTTAPPQANLLNEWFRDLECLGEHVQWQDRLDT